MAARATVAAFFGAGLRGGRDVAAPARCSASRGPRGLSPGVAPRPVAAAGRLPGPVGRFGPPGPAPRRGGPDFFGGSTGNSFSWALVLPIFAESQQQAENVPLRRWGERAFRRPRATQRGYTAFIGCMAESGRTWQMFFGLVKEEEARRPRRQAVSTILVVEDEPLVAFDNEHALEQAGYRVAATVDDHDHAVQVIDEGGVDLVIADGADFMATSTDEFDVIIIDSTDPVGPGEVLFTDSFYGYAKRRLAKDGVLVTQNGVPFMQPSELTGTMHAFEQLFADWGCYIASIPTYAGGPMAFGWGSESSKARDVDVVVLTTRLEAACLDLGYYTPSVHKAAFSLPRYIEKLLP